MRPHREKVHQVVEQVCADGYTKGDVYHLRSTTHEDGDRRNRQEADKRPQVLSKRPRPEAQSPKVFEKV